MMPPVDEEPVPKVQSVAGNSTNQNCKTSNTAENDEMSDINKEYLCGNGPRCAIPYEDTICAIENRIIVQGRKRRKALQTLWVVVVLHQGYVFLPK